MACINCGGSGVLDIVLTVELAPPYRVLDDPRVSWCHGCEAGAAWREAGLG